MVVSHLPPFSPR